MDAKVIAFPKVPPRRHQVAFWVQKLCQMLYRDIDLGARNPEKMFVCYKEAGRVYYLNLEFELTELETAIATVMEHIDDCTGK